MDGSETQDGSKNSVSFSTCISLFSPSSRPLRNYVVCYDITIYPACMLAEAVVCSDLMFGH